MARDYAFEALAEVTATDWETGRGELNAALKSIRAETEVTDSYLLADLIHERAKQYREIMPDALLTAPALAKHWKRVQEESERRRRPAREGTNRVVNAACSTCNGDRFVLVGLRGEIEEMGVCPDCNAIEITHYRYDGSMFRNMDPGLVRERMAGN